MKKYLAIMMSAIMTIAVPATAFAKEEISFITWRTEDADVLKEMVKAFEEANPDITVNLEITSNDITEYNSVLKSRLASGEGADVIMAHPGPELTELGREGNLIDLDDTGLAENMEEGLLGPGQVDGTQVSLIQTFNSFAVYYNKDIFDELPIAEPTSYEELKAACDAVKEAGYMPVSVGFGEGWVTEILYETLMCAYADGNENIIHDLETGDAVLTEEPYVSIFSDIAQMVDDGIFQDNALGTKYDASISLFASGRAAMLMDGTWSIGNLLSLNPDMNFGLFPIPSVSGKDIRPVSPSQGVGINAQTASPEACEKFLAYLFSVEGEEFYCNGTKQASTVKGTSLDVPEMDMVSALMEGETLIWPDGFVDDAELLSILDDLSARICAGGADVMQELEKSQAEIEAKR